MAFKGVEEEREKVRRKRETERERERERESEERRNFSREIDECILYTNYIIREAPVFESIFRFKLLLGGCFFFVNFVFEFV